MHGGLPFIGVSVLVYGVVGAVVIAGKALRRCRRARPILWQLQLQRCSLRDHTVKEVWMHNLGQDFQTHDDARPRPAEVVMLDHIDLARPHRLELPPTVLFDQGV